MSTRKKRLYRPYQQAVRRFTTLPLAKKQKGEGYNAPTDSISLLEGELIGRMYFIVRCRQSYLDGATSAIYTFERICRLVIFLILKLHSSFRASSFIFNESRPGAVILVRVCCK